MNNIFNYQRLLRFIISGLLFVMVIFGTLPLFILVAVFVALFLFIKVCSIVQYSIRLKFVLTIAYLLSMILQIVFFTSVVFPADKSDHLLLRLLAAIILPLPFLLEKLVVYTKNTSFYLPSVEDVSTITFTEFKRNKDKIIQAVHGVGKFKNGFTTGSLQEVLGDLNRHSFIRYINNGSLDDSYFKKARQSLSDPHLYLVISNTGSAASELIGLFTQKQFNHASLSFDKDLETIVSYNGGEHVYPPGLNPEIIQAFHKKADASVLVYRLSLSVKQKQKIISTIEQINQKGSAYNVLGLVTKRSMRRNIMFCSQLFVYTMLQIGNVEYFKKSPGNVQPTDFIELDYYRQLEYISEIKF